MISVSNDNVFALTNAYFSYVFRVSPEGVLEHLYYGRALTSPFDVPLYHWRTQRETSSVFEGHPHYSLADTPQEFPGFGRSDYRYPAFHGRNADGNTIFSPLYKSHYVTSQKPPLNGLPSGRGGKSQTLIITLSDALYGFEIDLHYTVYADYGVLARSAVYRNNGAGDIELSHAFSSALDLPPNDYEILHLHGTWSREFNVERFKPPQGRFTIESARGTSSAVHNPFMAILESGAGEDHGQVYAAALMYSGNFAISAEKDEFQSLRLLTGLNPFNFNWTLEPGQYFTAPEALHVYSGDGLRAMSHLWHDFVRDKISPAIFRNKPRPTYLNTWESAYFDIDENKVLRLADKAVDIGVDMLVLDDGWFEGRQDDSRSLGDWTADRERFPLGISEVAKKIKAKGLKFGIWFEPEMVSPNSALFRAHPDWVLHVPGRTSSLGRNQLTLDLCRPEVREYIFQSVDAVLSCGDIDYVKWDMNRNMTEAGSMALSADQQGEVCHRYMRGLYEILSRLTQKYPDILFENCASGGNRFDLGMQSYMSQNWPSDMCDPIGRLDIIDGLSHLFPLDVTAAYIGPSPNHQNGRAASLQTRFDAGVFCAARGISLNEAELDLHKGELRHMIAFASQSAQDMVGGYFDRIFKSDNDVCWQYRARDGKTVYLAYFHILAAPNMPFRRAHMIGLESHANYVLADGCSFSGDILMKSGMPLPYVATGQVSDKIRYMEKGDFSSHVFTFKRAAQ